MIFAFAFAWWAFLIAFNVLPKLWQSGVAALVTFIVVLTVVLNELETLFIIITILFALLTALLLIKKHLK